jgi:hypothetical protein
MDSHLVVTLVQMVILQVVQEKQRVVIVILVFHLDNILNHQELNQKIVQLIHIVQLQVIYLTVIQLHAQNVQMDIVALQVLPYVR